jgi:N-sulfoglucosamine sulfohydrolase
MSKSINAGLAAGVLLASLLLCGCQAARQEERPNIVWINAEDISPALGCYGDSLALTPHLDALAQRSVLFRQALAVAPICSPSRSTLATGIYPTTLGTEHLRSETPIPGFIQALPEHFREEGYFTSLYGKTDYNFEPEGLWEYWEPDEAPWRQRRAGQPFLSVFTFNFTHEGAGNSLERHERTVQGLPDSLRRNPAEMSVPPYYPDNEEARHLWARYYELVTAFDQQVGKMWQSLEEDDLLDNTIVFVYSDHGFGLPRYKRWLYDTGLRVPLLVYIPEKYRHLSPYPPGTATGDLVSFVDFVPTALQLIGRPIPDYMQGQPFLGEDLPPARQYAFAARSRADNAYDLARAVHSGRYLYVRHFMPHLPYIQEGKIFSDEKDGFRLLRQARATGQLPPAGEQMFQPKPIEELYDLANDPWELDNLAGREEYARLQDSLRRLMQDWILDSRDLGFLPESEIAARRRGETPYELGQDAARFDLPAIYRAAEQVGRADVATFRAMLRDPDSGVRYWAIIGLHGLGMAAREALPELEGRLGDPSKSVQIAAAELLCQFGREAQALPVLARHLQDPEPDVALQAARSLELSGADYRSIAGVVERVLQSKAAPPGTKSPYIDYNYAAFISWSLEAVLEKHRCRASKDCPTPTSLLWRRHRGD